MIIDLPTSLTVDGESKPINTDFRDVITILNAINDIDVPEREKNVILLSNLYVDDFTTFIDIDDAIKQAIWFIDWGKEYNSINENSPRLMDWEQDYNLIISAVNNKLSITDVRNLKYMHWWTFLGYFSERGECQFSTVTGIRDKLNKGRKLEKYEREILRENREQIILKNKNNEEFENELWGD